jgi:uncharacterized protein YjbI with pentapeptide repeats
MGWRDWTGVGERRWKTAPNEQVQPSKTLWDLLQLLIVPVILVGVSLLWSASQDTRDKSRADQVRQDTSLNDYFKQMSGLMLDKNLLSSKHGDPVRSVARTVTLATLRRLDGERKGEVVPFLQEARLIGGLRGSRVDLTGADLEHANLEGATLLLADLSGADLTGADLLGADLFGAILTDANLTNANLEGANLTGADLEGANLTGAALQDTDFTDAKLKGAKLQGALVEGAKGLPKGTP